MAIAGPPPAWVTDDTVIPPYPVLRCPRCKALFDDYSIHLCKSVNDAAKVDPHLK